MILKRNLKMSENQKPAKTYKQGQVSVSVWKSEGRPTSYTFQRSYKDKEDKWQHTSSLNLTDLYVVQKIIAKITSEELVVYENVK